MAFFFISKTEFTKKNKVVKIFFMKKAFFILILFFQTYLFANSSNSINHSKIKELSDFRVMGTFDLRTEKDISSPVKYYTINHEGGMNVRVLEVLKKDVYKNQKG